MTATETTPLLLRTLQEIDLAQVADNPWQPRTALDPDAVKEIADSIGQVGLLQPPLVRPSGDGYQIAFGHYRIAALRLLGIERAELEVRNLSDAEMAIIALTENKKRRDVPPIEQYRAWLKALDIEGMTIAMLADSLGLDRSTVSNDLRLLKLPAWVLEHVDNGNLSAHAAREFLCLMGSDGHFHDDVAHQVLDHMTKGTPDWRAARVRDEINGSVLSRPVSEWRRLFKGNSPGGGHAGEPAFDLAKFKEDQAARVHTLPDDEWTTGVWRDVAHQRGKVKQERSRDWTCATSAWTTRQSASKKAAEGVAKAVGKKSPAGSAKSGNFVKVLAGDPVFQAVSPETQGPLMKAMQADELDADAAVALGTRARPVQLKGGAGTFKAVVDEHRPQEQYGQGVTALPSYFPNIEECRKTCIIGATYGRFSDSGAFSLYCLNKDHFEEKVAKGKDAVTRKMTRKVEAQNEADAKAYRLLDKAIAGMPAPLMALLAARFLWRGGRFVLITPDNLSYDEARDLAVPSANVVSILTILGQEAGYYINGDNALKVLKTLDDGKVQELLLGLLVDEMQESQLAPFLKALEAPAK